MISRENVHIVDFVDVEWDTSIVYEVIVPIPNKIINNLPIDDKINYNCAKKSFVNTYNYENLKKSVNYEYDLRLKILNSIFENYKCTNKLEDIFPVFNDLDINHETHNRLAHIVEKTANDYEFYSKKLNKNLAQKKMLKDLENQCNIEHFLKDVVKILFHEISYCSNYNGYINNEELKKTCNLYLFAPDRDKRDSIHTESNKIMLSQFEGLNPKQFSHDLIYRNRRGFHNFYAAIIGRELVITYLNNLTIFL